MPGPAPSGVQRRISAAILVAVSGAALLGVVAWVVAALITAPRGLDLSDESFYLLSYRWWDVDGRAFSGVQYLYGPVYEALGFDIVALRVFRVVTILAANTVFGVAFVRWLRGRRPNAPDGRLWEISGVLLITATGGLILSWLPKSPGYNDVAALGTLLLAAAVLSMARRADRGELPSWVTGAVVAPVALAMLLTKWASAILTLGAIACLAACVILPMGWRATGRFLVPFVVSFAGCAVGFHVFVAPLDRVLQLMLETNALIARATNSPRALLQLYVDTTTATVTQIVVGFLPFLVVCALAPFARAKPAQFVMVPAVLVTAAMGMLPILRQRSFIGGSAHLGGYLPVVTSGIVLAGVVALAGWMARRLVALWGRAANEKTDRSAKGRSRWTWTLREAAVVGMLVLVPVLQAAGTGNPILVIATSSYSAWMAVVLWAWTRLSPAVEGWAAWLSGAVAAMVLVTSSVAAAVSGLWLDPYRTSRASVSTTPATGIPALRSVTLDPEQAADWAAYVEQLRPWTSSPGRRVMAFDEIAGLVLLVEGRSVGEAWYSALDQERTALGIEATCREQGPLTEQPPILVYRRAAAPSDEAALRACGLDLTTDYRQLPNLPERLNITVYVPKDTP